MAGKRLQRRSWGADGSRPRAEVWAIAARQHAVITRSQLLALGFSSRAIEHRLATGRLHRVHRGLYALGRPQLTQHGRWMAAALSCGPMARLSHRSAAELWGICGQRRSIRASPEREVDVLVPADVVRRRPGIRLHRRSGLAAEKPAREGGIPVTDPICTLVDLASMLHPTQVEAALNEADKLDLTNPDALRTALDLLPRRPGVACLRELLDRRAFLLTDSELERRFLPIARSAGLSDPQTGREVNGFKVDFYWPDLGLIVETDGLRYHRTPSQQARDRLRDQMHAGAGLTTLRFTHAQVSFERAHVRTTLRAVAARLAAQSRSDSAR